LPFTVSGARAPQTETIRHRFGVAHRSRGSTETNMVETRGARRQSMGLPRKPPAYASDRGKKELTTDGHWSGAKKGGARGNSFLETAGSTLFVLAIIATTPFIAVIVCVLVP